MTSTDSAPASALVPGEVPGKVFRSELNPVDFLRRAAYLYPDKTAVVDGGQRYSYRQLAERSWRLANALRSAGLGKGDRVATLLFNSSAMLEAHFGMPAAGGILVAVNHRLASAEIGYILEHSGARYLLLDAEFEALARPLELAGVTVIRCAGSSDPEIRTGSSWPAHRPSGRPAGWSTRRRRSRSTTPPAPRPAQGGAVHLPRRLPERAERGDPRRDGRRFGLPVDAADVPLQRLVLPVGGHRGGGAARDDARRGPGAGVGAIDAEGVTHYNGAPTVQLMIINHPRAHRLDRPVTAMVAAAPPSPTLFARMSELNFRIVHVYGLTETYGPITVCPEQEAWREFRLPSAPGTWHARGRRTSPLICPCRRHELNDVPQDGTAMGEVVMRGNNVMSGYFSDQAATGKAFAGGWLHSGDLAVWHPDGNIELRDRGKDIIISGGENISSIEVEQAICAHPAVLECAVIGIPHPHWGERPRAYVTLNEGAAATAEEIIAFCRERLAHYKCPDAVEFGPLPKTSTGKIQKFVLRDREWAGQDKRISGA